MKAAKRKKLEAKGWKVGNVAGFLELSNDEAAYIELKLKLAMRLKEARKEHRMTQQALAERIDSSQSRVAKMETGDRSVSIDLLVKALLALNIDIGETLVNSEAA